MRVRVVGGAGRMGFPFALAMTKKSIRVDIDDINKDACHAIETGNLPFLSSNEELLLLRNSRSSGLLRVLPPDDKSKADLTILCVPTPTRGSLGLLGELSVKATSPVLVRSTLPLDGFSQLKRVTGKVIAYIPERAPEGDTLKEIFITPQIVGALSSSDFSVVSDLFTRKMGIDSYWLTPRSAELAKLYMNAWRYIKFAAANFFYLTTSSLGENYMELWDVLQDRYDRFDLPRPGFVGGPCLIKDSALLVESLPMLGCNIIRESHHINSSLPMVLSLWAVSALGGSLVGKTIGLMGLAFKAGTADTRSSPTLDLKEVLESLGAKVLVHDPLIPETDTLDKVKEADLLILCTPHKELVSFKPPKLAIDPWGYWRKNT